MSSIHRAATLGGFTVISTTAALLTRYVIINRTSVARSLSPTTGKGLLRLILLLFSLLNIKNLPFVWHIRFLVRALLYHFRIEPKSVPPASLFEPLVTSTRAPLLECDTNLHKSNSTYFSDLDQSRAHLYACLMQKAFTREWKDDFLKPQVQPQLRLSDEDNDDAKKKDKAYSEVVKEGTTAAAVAEDAGTRDSTTDPASVSSSAITDSSITTAPTPIPSPAALGNNSNSNSNSKKPYSEPKGPYNMLLGSISCHYHREIPPYTRYELWSRILAWDHKWFYSVTHIVKPGVAVPKRWTMQPWRSTTRRKSNMTTTSSSSNGGSRSNRIEAREQELTEAEESTKTKTNHIKMLKENIYATSIAKVVVKRGRLTIPPEIILQRSGLLPDKTVSVNGSVHGHATSTSTGSNTTGSNTCNTDPLDSDTTTANTNTSSQQWTWHAMEQRRQQGLELAGKLAELDAAQALFDGGKDGALGEYADLFWA